MKRFWIGLGVVLAAIGGWLSITAMQYEPRVRPGTLVGPISVGGLTRPEAMRRVRAWWETEKRREIRVSIPTAPSTERAITLSQLGYVVDDVASIEATSLDGFWEGVRRSIAREDLPEQEVPVKLKPSGADLKPIRTFVAQAAGKPRPAKVTFEQGVITRVPEGSSVALDESRLLEVVDSAVREQLSEVSLPIQEGPKRVPDEALAKITDVMGEFSTRFPARQHDRNANIRLAAQKLNGHVLMPGETLSFNETVGERRAKDGFRLAGVYRDGRHDVDIGGGICQVSTTLYNAAVYSNLGIVRRQNHSMPVAYVPIGRDAAVSYGAIDLKIANTQDHPIAIASHFEPGRLTFRILGIKDPGVEVKVVSEGHRSWDIPVKYVVDRSLPQGKQRQIEKGSRGHAVTTYRVVRRNGVVVSRTVLARSHYRGGARIIAHNPGPSVDAAAVATPAGDVVVPAP